MDPRHRFTRTVEAYERFRPDYPDALLDWVADHAVDGRIVDVGSGTGILSRQQTFEHYQDLDLEGVLGRAWSSSYAVHGVVDAAAFEAALTEAFQRFAVGGVARLDYENELVAWPVMP